MVKQKDYPKYKERIKMLMIEGYGRTTIATKLKLNYPRVQRWMQQVIAEMEEGEMDALKESVKLAKSKQKLMDKNRVREKVLRESFRIDNAVEEYSAQIVELLRGNKLHTKTIKHRGSKSKAAGIVHISDAHFNELIDIEDVNEYNFNIASARLKLLAKRAKQYFKVFDIENILISMTGDMMNSDRRLDEILNMASNRSKATFLALDIMQQFIRDLNEDFNVSVAYVTGNESRVPKDIGWSQIVASDNYDTTIFEMLRWTFDQAEGVEFVHGGCNELAVAVGSLNILMLHGHGAIKKDVEKSVAQIKGRYASRGQIIDYVLFGHLHSARIGDSYARCSSLAGANAFSEEGLNLTSRASQNLYIVHQGGLLDGVKIDLQITSGEQYDIDSSLEAYNAKSAEKNKTRTIAHQILI